MRTRSATTRGTPGFRHGLRAVLALGMLLVAGAAHAQTGSGAVVTNVATAAFRAVDGATRSTASNPVQSLVTAACGLVITPDGTVAAPGHAVVARPGETISLPYLFRSAANLTASFTLEALLDPASALLPSSVALHLDLDGDGVLDPGEPTVTELVGVASGATVPLLLAVTLADDVGAAGDVVVDVVGRCAGDPSVVDDGNVALVVVARQGVGPIVKGSAPAPGSLLVPGARLRYEVAFEVFETPLVDVELVDPLDPSLAPPIGLVASVGGIVRPGAVRYDAASHALRASFDALPAGAAVVVEFETAVLAGVHAGTAVRNRADLTFAGGGATSNTVLHPVAAVCAVDVTPNGGVAFPGQLVTARPGRRAVLAYDLSNTGNGPTDYALTPIVLPASGFVPVSLAVIADLDEDGVPDAGELPLGGLLGVPAGGHVRLLVLVDLPIDAHGVADVDLVASCAGNPTVVDDGNVGAVAVEEPPVTTLHKGAVPPSGSPLYPGAPVRYVVTFQAPRALVDVVVRDPLDPGLETPSFVTDGRVVDPGTGAGADVRASIEDGAVVWRLGAVPAGMTVRLEVATTVRRDVAAGTWIVNRADLRDGDADAPLVSNLTRHPVEALAVQLTKASDPSVARSGERLTYRLVSRNASDDLVLPGSDLVDDLPAGVRYLAGSAEATGPDGSIVAFEPEVEGPRLRWRLPELAPGEAFEVRFAVQVLELSRDGETLVNHATLRVLDSDGTTLTATATSAVTTVAPGVLSPHALLLGTAYVDLDGDGHYDATADRPLAGLRLFLADGTTTVTDALGRYTFAHLMPGVAVLKLDATTLPPRLLTRTPTAAANGLWRLTLFHGTITRQDIPFAPPEGTLAVRQELTVVRGPVQLLKRIYPHDRDGERATVHLIVRSTEAIRGLVVEDEVPMGARVAADATIRFEVRDLASGEVTEWSYDLLTAGPVTDLPLSIPSLRWELRP